MGVLEQWKVSLEEIDEVVSANPSLRGFLFGYLNEYKLRKMWFSDPRIQDLKKYNNHDRAHKGDLSFRYQGAEICVECKGLQTNSVKKTDEGYIGKFQCDASDRRKVTLPNKKKIETTCLLVGEFDLLAVGLFEFGQEWRFAFAKNQDLPRTRSPKYTEKQRQHLLATTMEITWPLKPPFETEPFRLIEKIAYDKRKMP